METSDEFNLVPELILRVGAGAILVEELQIPMINSKHLILLKSRIS